jgi:hypothetical protein
VSDKERAQAALAFAKRYELLGSESLSNIKLVELDYSDADSIAEALPRRGRLVVVDGDVVVGGRQGDVSVVARWCWRRWWCGAGLLLLPPPADGCWHTRTRSHCSH